MRLQKDRIGMHKCLIELSFFFLSVILRHSFFFSHKHTKSHNSNWCPINPKINLIKEKKREKKRKNPEIAYIWYGTGGADFLGVKCKQ